MPDVMIWTDGSADKDGHGGAAAVLLNPETGRITHRMKGFEVDATNQSMELFAAVLGLSALKRPVEVALYSDSAYLINCFNEGWIEKWRANGWRNSKKEPVANQELWETLEALAANHDVDWRKVKGHSGNAMNEKADQLAGFSRHKATLDELRRPVDARTSARLRRESMERYAALGDRRRGRAGKRRKQRG